MSDLVRTQIVDFLTHSLFYLLQFDQFVLDTQDVFNFDGLISSHPLYVPVNHPDEIGEIFDKISYTKVIIDPFNLVSQSHIRIVSYLRDIRDMDS